jgi:hypothetical protein
MVRLSSTSGNLRLRWWVRIADALIKQNKTGQGIDKTRSQNTRHKKKARPKHKRPDQTRPDQTRPDDTREEKRR